MSAICFKQYGQMLGAISGKHLVPREDPTLPLDVDEWAAAMTRWIGPTPSDVRDQKRAMHKYNSTSDEPRDLGTFVMDAAFVKMTTIDILQKEVGRTRGPCGYYSQVTSGFTRVSLSVFEDYFALAPSTPLSPECFSKLVSRAVEKSNWCAVDVLLRVGVPNTMTSSSLITLCGMEVHRSLGNVMRGHKHKDVYKTVSRLLTMGETGAVGNVRDDDTGRVPLQTLLYVYSHVTPTTVSQRVLNLLVYEFVTVAEVDVFATHRVDVGELPNAAHESTLDMAKRLFRIHTSLGDMINDAGGDEEK